MHFTSDGRRYEGFQYLHPVFAMPVILAVVFWDGEYDFWAVEGLPEAIAELRRYYKVERDAPLVDITVYQRPE